MPFSDTFEQFVIHYNSYKLGNLQDSIYRTSMQQVVDEYLAIIDKHDVIREDYLAKTINHLIARLNSPKVATNEIQIEDLEIIHEADSTDLIFFLLIVLDEIMPKNMDDTLCNLAHSLIDQDLWGFIPLLVDIISQNPGDHSLRIVERILNKIETDWVVKDLLYSISAILIFRHGPSASEIIQKNISHPNQIVRDEILDTKKYFVERDWMGENNQ